MKEVKGNIITMALNADFDVIVHGCNCFNTMSAGLAPQMAKAFQCDLYHLEKPQFKGNIDKLGRIDVVQGAVTIIGSEFFGALDSAKPYMEQNSNYKPLYVVNAYTQYNPKKDLSYQALILCLIKINHRFKGKHIGIPHIGCGIAGGNWNIVKKLITKYLKDIEVTIVEYDSTPEINL